MSTQPDRQVYGVMARFASPEELVTAADKVSAAGYRHTEAYSSFPVHGVHEALGARKSRLAAAVFVGGLLGLLGGFFLQYWISATAYPHIVSGKPLFSWPSFIPVVFECTILGASLTAFVGMLARNGLPRPHHPVFDGTQFHHATTDGFFLCIEATDPLFDQDKALAFFKDLAPEHVETVFTDASA